MKKITKIAALILSSFLLFSCSKTEIIYKDVLDPVDIVLEEKEKRLTIGETYQIQARYVVEDGDEPAQFIYKSLNTSVATVSDTGLIEAVDIGEAIIQITYKQSKALLKIIVQGGEESSLLGLTIYNQLITLYKDDQIAFGYESTLNGNPIELTPTYYDYDSSIISIENNIITGLSVGNTNAKIKVTYGDLVAEKSFTVAVQEASYYLACNYENNQVVVGEEDLQVTYSLNYGRTTVRNVSLSEMECNISDSEVASINGNAIHGIKKGYFDLEVSYYVSEIGENVVSSDSFRSRERYVVKSIDLDAPIYVLDGDRITYIPTNPDGSLVFDAWLKDGVEFDEPVESNLRLGVRWKINEFNFAQDIRDAKSFAPHEGEEGETILAVSYDDGDLFTNGLKYDLSKNCHGDYPTINDDANIYLPKIDYRKTNKITYLWKTNGYVTIDQEHWYGGALPLGGTIDITYNGKTLTQTITQTYDVSDPFSGRSYKGVSRTFICDDTAVINGNENLKSIAYWAYTSITTTSCIYLSNPKVSISHEYLPYFRLGNYSGAEFYTTHPDAHYDSDSKKPTIIPTLSSGDDSNEDYLYYYQDRLYDESQGWTHCYVDYTLTLPAINFAAQDETIVIPFEVEDGFYIGFEDSKAVTNCSGQLRFDYNQSTGLFISLRSESGSDIIQDSYICLDSDVINGSKGFTLPSCYSMFCFQRGAMVYQPRFAEACTQHEYANTSDVDRIGNFGTYCTICGEPGGLSEDLMHLSDIDLVAHQYGAHGGRWEDEFPITDTDAFRTEKTLKYEVFAANTEELFYLPRINYQAYTSVKFSISCDSWAIEAGLASGSYILPYCGDFSSDHSTGSLMLAMNGDNLVATLTCLESSQSQQITITDQDIINGEAPLGLYANSKYLYQTVTIELAGLLDSCAHNYVASTNKIGVEVCSICGDERNYKNSLNEIDFVTSQYGAHGGRWGAEFPVTAGDAFKTERTLKYEVTAGNTENAIYLPKINFKSFSSVQFNVICGSFAIGAGLESGSYIMPGSSKSSDPAHTGVLTLTLNGNQLKATLVCNETSETQTVVITNLDIINGRESVALYMYSVNYAYQTVTVELTALN